MRLNSSVPISFSATSTSRLEKKEERGTAKATATRRTLMCSFLGGSGQWSPLDWPAASAGNRNITARQPAFIGAFYTSPHVSGILISPNYPDSSPRNVDGFCTEASVKARPTDYCGARVNRRLIFMTKAA